jgi:hypothetical protein
MLLHARASSNANQYTLTLKMAAVMLAKTDNFQHSTQLILEFRRCAHLEHFSSLKRHFVFSLSLSLIKNPEQLLCKSRKAVEPSPKLTSLPAGAPEDNRECDRNNLRGTAALGL